MAKPSRKDLEALVADDPNDPFLRYCLAMEYIGEGDHETALTCLRQLIDLSPDYVPAYLQAGQALTRLDREEEARAMYRTGIATAQKKGDIHAGQEMERFLDAIS